MRNGVDEPMRFIVSFYRKDGRLYCKEFLSLANALSFFERKVNDGVNHLRLRCCRRRPPNESIFTDGMSSDFYL